MQPPILKQKKGGSWHPGCRRSRPFFKGFYKRFCSIILFVRGDHLGQLPAVRLQVGVIGHLVQVDDVFGDGVFGQHFFQAVSQVFSEMAPV